MNLEKLRLKLFHRLTSPVELLYDVSRHWFVVLLALGLGTFIAFAVVTSQPPIFECDAVLKLEQNQIAADLDPRRPSTKESDLAFIEGQLALLKGDSVIERVVLRINSSRILEQEEDPNQNPQGIIQKSVKQVQGVVKDLLGKLGSKPEGTLAEVQKQSAMDAFRRRSSAQNDIHPPNIVRLRVVGTRRDSLKEELKQWIESYRYRIEQLSDETYNSLYKSLIDRWEKTASETMIALTGFQGAHPDVSQLALEKNKERIFKLQFMLDQLQFTPMVDDPRGVMAQLEPGAAPPAGPDQLAVLKKRKDELETELLALKAKVPETNDKYKLMKQQLDNLSGAIVEREKEIAEQALKDTAAEAASDPKNSKVAAKDTEKDPAKDPAKDLAKDPAGKKAPGASPKPADKDASKSSEVAAGDAKKESPGGDGKAPSAASNRREKMIEDVRRALNDAIREAAKLEAEVAQLNTLSKQHEDAENQLRTFKAMKERRTDQTMARQQVDIQVQDDAMVSISPINNPVSRQAPIGAAIGICVGVFIAFALEFFNRRIRFKRDVEDELGLTVVGVIPEN